MQTEQNVYNGHINNKGTTFYNIIIFQRKQLNTQLYIKKLGIISGLCTKQKHYMLLRVLWSSEVTKDLTETCVFPGVEAIVGVIDSSLVWLPVTVSISLNLRQIIVTQLDTMDIQGSHRSRL